ncbi:putative general receptor for phosphoinositides 1-associated scaffold protein isoform X1 [Apostichopus japonicus]|uniref:Putative general receptor for phosphoinositides 1-associated scaffold protein isoform X1 n=1 Tax=Stichopus japonicus TaxID=307972 RepID=A0A2G8LGN7_STIJA|nr:putative general receptor for phosphoinositides 1-associated scaffold protein isoform X1 [Apostichopus japonicus]
MKTFDRKREKSKKYLKTTGEIPEEVKQDKGIRSEDYENPRRRSIVIQKTNETFGFELQTYAIHHKGRRELELCTYVCTIHKEGPAHLAGMLPGDIILSVNGISVEKASHETIVHLIKRSSDALRLVVLFEDCIRRVALHKRMVQLRRKLFEKKLAYRALLAQEKQILLGFGETKLDCSSSILSEDSGFVSTPDLCREPSFLNSKSQSMMSVTSVSSTGFCISDVPGNQSVEHIASLKV